MTVVAPASDVGVSSPPHAINARTNDGMRSRRPISTFRRRAPWYGSAARTAEIGPASRWCHVTIRNIRRGTQSCLHTTLTLSLSRCRVYHPRSGEGDRCPGRPPLDRRVFGFVGHHEQ